LTDKDDKDENINWKPIIIVGFLIALLWIWTFVSFVFIDAPAWFPIKDRGSFGDMFGGLNALFSGFAFTGIIFTILMQRKELALQRKELRYTHEILEAQRQEMKAQNETLKIQQFENTFFSMLSSFNEVVNSIEVSDIEGGSEKGRKRIQSTGKDFYAMCKPLKNPPINYGLTHCLDEYSNWFKLYEVEFGPYFRTMFKLIEFVHLSGFGNKKVYIDLLCAQLSSYEAGLLFYHCLSDNGLGNFKELVEKYGLLKHMPNNFLLSVSHREYYELSAFGEVE